jgi:hypothetical protein
MLYGRSVEIIGDEKKVRSLIRYLKKDGLGFMKYWVYDKTANMATRKDIDMRGSFIIIFWYEGEKKGY